MFGARQTKRLEEISKLALLTSSLLLLLMSSFGVCYGSSLAEFLHKDCRFDSPSDFVIDGSKVKPISPHQAAESGVRHLQTRGVKGIVICEIFWIAAPLGGYLVDAKGQATINGNDFSSFRVGIRDGSDYVSGNSSAGAEFVFIARGKNKSGQSVWYPSPGPDYELVEGGAVTEGMLAYEFLLNREKFETLGTRYP
jgi:hypothetical protein